MKLISLNFLLILLAVLIKPNVHLQEIHDRIENYSNEDLDNFIDNYAANELYKEWLNELEKKEAEKRAEQLLFGSLDDFNINENSEDSYEYSDSYEYDYSNLYDDSKDNTEKRLFGSIFGKSRFRTTKPYIATTTAPSNVANDAFYILKKKCDADPFDSYCRSKKKEMYDLVSRCEDLTLRKGGTIQACKDIVSLYCYVFKRQDILTCALKTYDEYVPGKQTTAYTTRYTTRYTTTTTRPTTTTTKRKTEAPRPTNPPVQPPSNDVSNNPFKKIPGFTGTITSIPKDTNLLREIGQYCLKLKIKDKNCDILLGLLKQQFKKCEKRPSSDSECQSFKIQFCTAYPTFNCCNDVLAGRTCKSSSVHKRRENRVHTNVLRTLLQNLLSVK